MVWESKTWHKLSQGLGAMVLISVGNKLQVGIKYSKLLEYSNHAQAAVMYREWSPRPSAGGSWKKDVERSRADGTSRERGCPGPGGPRLFSSQWEESGSFYSSPSVIAIAIRCQYSDLAPGLLFLIPPLPRTFRKPYTLTSPTLQTWHFLYQVI
jgi:hypothetical protein